MTWHAQLNCQRALSPADGGVPQLGKVGKLTLEASLICLAGLSSTYSVGCIACRAITHSTHALDACQGFIRKIPIFFQRPIRPPQPIPLRGVPFRVSVLADCPRRLGAPCPGPRGVWREWAICDTLSVPVDRCDLRMAGCGISGWKAHDQKGFGVEWGLGREAR